MSHTEQDITTSWTRIQANEQEEEQEEETPTTEFVNHGLQRWEAARAKWHASKCNDTDSGSREVVNLDVDEIIDIIFSPRWRMSGQEHGPPRRFPQNVPLMQMVDVLVDLWEAEGLDM